MKNRIFLLAMIMVQMVFLPAIASAEQDTIRAMDVEKLMSGMASSEKMVVIDAGSLLACLDARIPGAVCLPCDDDRGKSFFASLPKESKIVFYSAYQPLDRNCALIREANSAGFKDLFLLTGGLVSWRKAGNPVVSERRIPRVAAIAVKPLHLTEWLKKTRNPLLIDIRSPEVFAAGHLEGAVNIPLTRLQVQYADIPLDRTLLIVDEDGRAAFLAASYLARKGFANILRLQGGMADYQRGVR